MSELDLVLNRLDGVEKRNGSWQARCPAHDDHTPSLSITEGDDGKVLLKCFAGCTSEDITGAIGLTLRDLFPDVEGDHRKEYRKITQTYDYHDAEGKIIFQTVRFEPKSFSQRRPDGRGGWKWNLKGIDPVLYRQPKVLKAAKSDETVYIVEGEKDADRLIRLGFTATTNPMGARKWRESYSETLRGAHVMVLPDADKPGREHAEQVARSLQDKAVNVKVLELPELSEKGDVSDWLDSGGTAEKLKRLALETPEWEPTPEAEAECVGKLLNTVKPEQVSWLWPSRIPLGKLTLIDGDPGTGKSAMTTDIAARVSMGSTFPDGSSCEPSGVVLLSAEDGLADTIRPRLEAAGADLSCILALATIPDGDSERLLSIPDDLGIIKRGIERVGAKLVVVDPLMAFLSGDVNSHRDQDVRRALASLAKLAEETGVAVVVVRHLNKGIGGNSLYRGGGSIGIIGQARSALLVAKHPEDDQKRVLASLKNNLSTAAPSLVFVLNEATNGAVHVGWKGETFLDADALLATPMDDEKRWETAALRDTVVDHLEENGGTWEGTPQELYEELADVDLAALPDRPDELSKRLSKIARMGQTFTVSRSRKRNGDKVMRVLKLRLSGRSGPEPLNGVYGGNGVHNNEEVTEKMTFGRERYDTDD